MDVINRLGNNHPSFILQMFVKPIATTLWNISPILTFIFRSNRDDYEDDDIIYGLQT